MGYNLLPVRTQMIKVYVIQIQEANAGGRIDATPTYGALPG
jgi:hypothetical protein